MEELTRLVEAAQAGDSEACAALMQRFQGMAYATAYRYIGDHQLAQDIVQEAIIEALLHLPQLQEPSAFPGWFRQIVFRQCTRMLRQATLPSSSLETTSADLVAEIDTEDQVMLAERKASVRSALASLPRHEQLVAALFYGCGYSYSEVSALLKVPITTVKKRLHSARQKLRVQLQAALRDEIDPRSNEEAEIAAILLRRWWNKLMGFLAIMKQENAYPAVDLQSPLMIFTNQN